MSKRKCPGRAAKDTTRIFTLDIMGDCDSDPDFAFDDPKHFKPSSSSNLSRSSAARNGRTKKSRSKKRFSITHTGNTDMNSELLQNVNSNLTKKIENNLTNFLKSGNFLSDDEEEGSVVTIPDSCGRTTVTDICEVSDSDEEIRPSSVSEPIPTSTVTSGSEFVEDILESADTVLNQLDPADSDDNWDEVSKKTDELLASAFAVLEGGSDSKEKSKEKTPKKETEATKPTCPICLEVLGGSITSGATVCGHIFCLECIKQVVKIKKACPTCRKRLTVKQVHPLYL